MTLFPFLLLATVSVTGTVTYVARDRVNSGILQPAGDAAPLWFAGERNRRVTALLAGADALCPGDVVAVTGERSDLGFAPGLAADEICLLGHGLLPVAQEVTLRDLAWGVRDNARVALTGVLTSVRPIESGCVRLSLTTREGDFAAEAAAAAADWPSLVDATLRLEGAAMSFFNVRGEFHGVLLEVVGPESVRVVEAAGDPFARPLTPLDRILPYDPAGPDLHRRHVTGVVTYAKRGECFYLADGTATLKVRAPDSTVRTGDRVEAVGFASRRRGFGFLDSADVRAIGSSPLPEPVRVGWAELADYTMDSSGRFVNYDGRRATFEGRLSSFVPKGDGATLVLTDAEDVRMNVTLDEMPTALSSEDVVWRPTVRVTGVLELEQPQDIPERQMPAILGWTMHVSAASSLEVLHDDAWIRRRAAEIRRLAFEISALVVFVALVILVRYLLRLRAGRRRQEILTLERRRMAADLHDTLEQHLAGARMVLNSAVDFTPDVPETVKGAVAQANGLLAQAKSEMRTRILDLRSDILFDQRLEDLLRGLAVRINARRVVRVRTLFRGLPERIPAPAASELVAIVQEAVTNAIKHGHAKNIILAADSADGGRFRLTVANDGEPFDPAAALGPESGHYGLAGMRERAAREHMTVAFETVRRWTALRIVVPR